MNKQAVINFLSTLPEYSTLRDDLANARRDCNAYNWDRETYLAIEKGIVLWHEKPSMLAEYIRQFAEN